MSVPDTSFSDLNEEDPGFCRPPLKLKQTWSISAHRQSSAWITHAHAHTHPSPCVKVKTMCYKQWCIISILFFKVQFSINIGQIWGHSWVTKGHSFKSFTNLPGARCCPQITEWAEHHLCSITEHQPCRSPAGDLILLLLLVKFELSVCPQPTFQEWETSPSGQNVKPNKKQKKNVSKIGKFE